MLLTTPFPAIFFFIDLGEKKEKETKKNTVKNEMV